MNRTYNSSKVGQGSVEIKLTDPNTQKYHAQFSNSSNILNYNNSNLIQIQI